MKLLVCRKTVRHLQRENDWQNNSRLFSHSVVVSVFCWKRINKTKTTHSNFMLVVRISFPFLSQKFIKFYQTIQHEQYNSQFSCLCDALTGLFVRLTEQTFCEQNEIYKTGILPARVSKATTIILRYMANARVVLWVFFRIMKITQCPLNLMKEY